MRKSALILGLAVLAAAPLSAGGVALAYATWDTDTADDDQGLAVKIEVDLGSQLDLEARASFFDSLQQAAGPVLFEIEAAPIDLGVNYHFGSGKASPYVTGGISMVLIKPNDQDNGVDPPSRPRSQEEFGWYGGLGVEFEVARSLSIFAEALYRDASGEVRGRGLGTQPARDFEIDFGGAAGYLGVAFSW